MDDKTKAEDRVKELRKRQILDDKDKAQFRHERELREMK